MNDAARIRQRILALFLPLTAVLYVSCEALNPKGTDTQILNMADALKVLPIAARHPGQLYLSGSLSLVALGALAVSWAAIATLVRGRGATLATVAALLGGIGAFCGALVNVLVGVNLAAAATAPISHAAAGHFLVTTFNSGFEHVFMDVYLAGIVLAPVLMGIALWRSRSVPRWLAVLFAAGLELAQQVPSAGPVRVILLMLPFAVAMVLLSARVWQAAAGPAGGLASGPASPPAAALASTPAGAAASTPAGAAVLPGAAAPEPAAYRR